MPFSLIRKFLTQRWLYLFAEGVGWEETECLYFHLPVSEGLGDLKIAILTGVSI